MTFRERLWTPVSYWMISLFFGLTFVSAVTFMLGNTLLISAVVATAIAIGWVLLGWGSATIVVDADGVRAGGSLLEWPYIGPTETVPDTHRYETRSDTRAFRLVRPYLRDGVRITVEDPADPHPYWVLGSRRPAELRAVIEHNRRAVAGTDGESSPVESPG